MSDRTSDEKIKEDIPDGFPIFFDKSGNAYSDKTELVREEGGVQVEDDVDKLTNGVVPLTDDPEAPTFTFRVILLGTLWCIFLGGANAILAFRTNPFAISSTVATLLSYPAGRFLAATLPPKPVSLFSRINFNLNPGPFTMKEHVLISVIASAGAAGAYGLDNVVTQKASFFMGNEKIGFIESLAWIFASQFIGFGLAGLMRRFVVWPKAMFWPSTLSTVALFVSFHPQDAGENKKNDDGVEEPEEKTWKISRFNFFMIVFAGIFTYTWIPEFFMVALQTVSLLCFVSKNKTLRFLASSDNGGGIGLGAVTFDWNYIGGAWLTTPFWAALNTIISNWVWAWLLVPILYYSNAFGKDQIISNGATDSDGAILPVLNSVGLFDNTGTPLSPLKLYNTTTFNLNETAYAERGPVYITSFFALSYGSSFMAVSATVTHVFLWYGTTILHQLRALSSTLSIPFLSRRSTKTTNSTRPTTDIHNRLMTAYPEVPESFYLTILVVMTLFMCVVATFTAFTMPVWSVLLAIGIAGVMLLPICVIAAVTGSVLYLNVLTEFVIGLMIPGQTVAVMAFKSLGTNTAIQALSLITDLKLGHYMHIAPRKMLAAQMYGTFIGAIVSTTSSFYVMSSMTEIIGKGDWQALGYRTFYSAGAIWGAIGPQRFFGIGAIYGPLLYFFLIGFILPIFPYIGSRIHPSPRWEYINIPLIAYFAGPGGFQNGHIIPLIVAFVFQYYLFRKRNAWWKKYNYVLAVALDSGAAVCVLVVTVLANYAVEAPVWGGNPEVGKGVPMDYYCSGMDFRAPPEIS